MLCYPINQIFLICLVCFMVFTSVMFVDSKICDEWETDIDGKFKVKLTCMDYQSSLMEETHSKAGN